MTATPFDLDALLDEVVLHAAVEGGRDPALVAAGCGASRTVAAAAVAGGPPARRGPSNANRWTAAEQAFLEEWAGELGDREIARRLGRSEAAVRVRRIRRGLRGPMVYADYLTAQDMARALGVDVKSICALIERGLLPAEIAPLPTRKVWRMRRSAFVAWAVNPMHWPYFYRVVRAPERIRDVALRRLIVRRAAEWGDEWWTPGEVAAYHGVSDRVVNRRIRAGRLAAVRWSNWMVRRSDAASPATRFFGGKGGAMLDLYGTPRGDAFLVLAAAVGIPDAQIGRMTGREGSSAVRIRLDALHRAGYIPWLIHAYELPVAYRPTDGALWADWRPLAHRFPRLARAWARWEAGELRRRDERSDRNLVNGVLRAAVVWHLGEAGAALVGRLVRCDRAAEAEAWARWKGWAAAELPSPGG